MKSTWLRLCLLWGLAFGMLEAAYFTRVNNVYPLGASHIWLALVFSAGFALLACLAGGITAAWRRARGDEARPGGPDDATGAGISRSTSILPILAGPWLLLLVLIVSIYRTWINPRPNDLCGNAMSLVCVLAMLVLLVLLARWLRNQSRGVARVLGGAGLVLWMGAAVWLATARPSPSPPPPAETVTVEMAGGVQDTGLRVLLVGLDGGTWTIMDPELAAGKMPAHAGLIARGVAADLKVTLPTYSPPLWTSIASSRTTAEHGIHDHIRTALPLGLPTVPLQVKHLGFLTKAALVTVRALHRQFKFPPVFAFDQDVFVRRLWDILDEYGLASLVLDWYVTYPVPPRLGITVSDHLHLRKGATVDLPGLVWPDSLTEPFAELVITPAELPAERLFGLLDAEDLDEEGRAELRRFYPRWFSVIAKEMARDLSTQAIARAAFPLLPNWRFAGIYFRAMDNIHHMSWRHKDLPGENLAAHPERRFRKAVTRYYAYSDSLLASLLEFADERTVIIAMSDHGWENARYGHSRAPDGFFVMAGGPVLRQAERRAIHIHDVAPTVLALLGFPAAEDMHGRVAVEFVDPAFWAQHPVRHVSTYETSPRAVRSTEAFEMDEATVEHLRSLGYVE